jgi:hypothetical protein
MAQNNSTVVAMDVDVVTSDKVEEIKTRKKMPKFHKYIFQVLNKIHPDIAISCEAMNMMNTLITDMMLKLAQKASKCNKIRKKTSPLVESDIAAAVCSVFPDDMAFHALLSAFRSQTRESVEVLCDLITEM